MKKIKDFNAGFIVLLGLVAFGPTLWTGFLWDDHEMIENNPFVQKISVKNIHHAFGHDVFDGKGDAYFRPAQTFMNMVDYQIWGFRPFGFHLTNLVFHIASALLLYFLMVFLFKDKRFSFLASALFVVHPVVVEQLLIVAGRAEIMALTFTLAALLTAIQKKRKFYWLSVFFYALACLSKETGVVFPLLLFLIGTYSKSWRLPWKSYLPYGFVLALYLMVRGAAVSNASVVPPASELFLFMVRDLPAVMVEYLRIILFPVDLHSHRRMLFSVTWNVFSTLVIVLMVVYLVRKRSRLAWLPLAWFGVVLLPKIPILATNALMLDHWVYPGAIGVAGVVAYWLAQRRTLVLAGIILLFWTGTGWWNIKNRNTDKEMYEWALHHPTSSIVRYNLGLIHYQDGGFKKAQNLFRDSMAMNTESVLTANGLALALWKTGKRNEALELLDQWAEKRPGHAQTYFNRSLMKSGRKALADVDKAVDVNPGYEEAWTRKAELLYGLKDIAGSIAANLEAHRINPGNLQVLSNLGYLYVVEKDFKNAEKYWSYALVLNPQDPEILGNMMWLRRKKMIR